ncbi:unnamed protein product [Rhizoctonia solani]|nr:unnamed protein product [Rhizoctonia solani]
MRYHYGRHRVPPSLTCRAARDRSPSTGPGSLFPKDKCIPVDTLKGLGEIVGITSDGIARTEIANEDIILLFVDCVRMWGRRANDSTFTSAVLSDKKELVLTTVQLLWINIIMDTFAALALATDPTSPQLPKCMPDCKTAPLFTVDMGEMVINQSIYQTLIVRLFHLGGSGFWVYHSNLDNAELLTMAFNSINYRGLTSDKDIFRGLTKNWNHFA